MKNTGEVHKGRVCLSDTEYYGLVTTFIVSSGLNYDLGRTSVDLIKCRSWNFEYVFRNICYGFFSTPPNQFKTEKKIVSYWSNKKTLTNKKFIFSVKSKHQKNS